MQLRGTTRHWSLAVLRNATLCVAACARGNAATSDAALQDGAPADAAPRPHDASPDARHPDGAVDAGCAISAGVTPTLDGTHDLASYPAAQQLNPGAMVGTDAAAVAWDKAALYVTVTSGAFAGAYEPLHVYVEAGTGLATAVPANGKEYSGLVPALPFTPTHLIAIRRVTDAGTGAYDGVYVPAATWTTRQTALAPGVDVFASADQQTLSVKVGWAALGGCPTALRLAVHVVHAVSGNEWKDLVPATHTPWQVPGGGYYELDLTGAPAVAGWTLR